MFNDVIAEMSKFKTQVFSAFYLNRKLCLNLLSFQRVLKEVTKFAALIIVLIKRRSEYLNESEKILNNF